MASPTAPVEPSAATAPASAPASASTPASADASVSTLAAGHAQSPRDALIAAVEAALVKKLAKLDGKKVAKKGKHVTVVSYPRIEPEYWATTAAALDIQFTARFDALRDSLVDLVTLRELAAIARLRQRSSIETELTTIKTLNAISIGAGDVLTRRIAELDAMVVKDETGTLQQIVIDLASAADSPTARARIIDAYLAGAPPSVEAQPAEASAASEAKPQVDDDGLPLEHTALVKCMATAAVIARKAGELVSAREDAAPTPPSSHTVAKGAAATAAIVVGGLVGGIPAGVAYVASYAIARFVRLFHSTPKVAPAPAAATASAIPQSVILTAGAAPVPQSMSVTAGAAPVV